MFTNAIHRSFPGPSVRLVDAPSERWHDARQRRRTIERWQTQTFVVQAMQETGSQTPYALEERMMEGVADLQFPVDRPKLCDRMLSRGEPAVAKFLGLRPAKDLRTKSWFDRMVELAPGAAEAVKSPIWRLLDPATLTFVDADILTFEVGYEILKAGLSLRAWRVCVESSGRDPEREYFVHDESAPICRTALARHLLALRRYEVRGDQIGYQLELRESVRLARSAAQPDVAVIQPLIGDFIACCFGAIDVPIDDFYFAWQIEAGQRAWDARTPLFD
jgi:hypothetical protein